MMAEGGNNDPVIKTHSILQDYTVHWNEKLGTGISGPVRPCMHKVGGGRYALKCLHDNPKSQTEVNLHIMCSKHPNIVKVLDVYANDLQFPGDKQPKPYLLMVLEMMEGGELFDRISKEKRFTERKAARYFKKIAVAVRHCHSLNVAHRDLKPENILLSDNSQDAEVKLSDFGFAKIDDGNLQTPYFTPYYVAPQVLEAHRHQSRLKKGLIQTSKPYTYDKWSETKNASVTPKLLEDITIKEGTPVSKPSVSHYAPQVAPRLSQEEDYQRVLKLLFDVRNANSKSAMPPVVNIVDLNRFRPNPIPPVLSCEILPDKCQEFEDLVPCVADTDTAGSEPVLGCTTYCKDHRAPNFSKVKGQIIMCDSNLICPPNTGYHYFCEGFRCLPKEQDYLPYYACSKCRAIHPEKENISVNNGFYQ